MIARCVLVCSVLLPLLACAGAPDRPASPERMGRFMGLVAQCGCSDIGVSRMVAEYPKALGDRYGADDVRRMRGFVEVGASESFSNQIPICAEVCSQACMVNSVVKPLGGRVVGDGATCPVDEDRLNLTTGWTDLD